MASVIEFYESLSYNAWPALDTLMFDGWILRFGKGYTKRSNSINPLYEGTMKIAQKHYECEKYYKKFQLPVTYKLTDLSHSLKIDAFLQHLNYEKLDITSVQTLNLEIFQDCIKESDLLWPFKGNITPRIQFTPSFTQNWFTIFTTFNPISLRNQTTATEILQRIYPEHWFYTLHETEKTDSPVIACGLGVLQANCFGIFDIIVDPKRRREGFGTSLILSMLNHAQKQGATQSYLQVVDANEGAKTLYAKIGYQERYKYWYRRKV